MKKIMNQMKLDSAKDLHNEIFCLSQERDFFKGKFTEQVTEIANLQEQLKRAKKEIDSLRQDLISMDHVHGNLNVDDDILSLAGTVTSTAPPSKASSPPASVSSLGRPNINDTHKDDEDIEKEEPQQPQEDSKSADNMADSTSEEEKEGEREVQDTPRQTPSTDESENQESEDDEEGDIKDDQTEATDAEDIRKNAAKMLIWANYQCARKPSTRSVASTTGSTQSPMYSATDQDFSNFSMSAAESHVTSPTSPPRFHHSPSVPQTIHATTPERPTGPLAKIKQFLDPSLSSSSPESSGNFDSDSDLGSDYDSDSESDHEDSPEHYGGRLLSLEHMVTSL